MRMRSPVGTKFSSASPFIGSIHEPARSPALRGWAALLRPWVGAGLLVVISAPERRPGTILHAVRRQAAPGHGVHDHSPPPLPRRARNGTARTGHLSD